MKTITQTQAKPVTKPVKPSVSKKTTATKTKGITLYWFDMTPSMRDGMLRAYFVGAILAQIGGLYAGKFFRLWSGNFAGHLATKKLIKKPGGYELSVAGVNYFNDPAQEAEKDMIEAFRDAVKTGKAPKFYNYAMRKVEFK